MSKKIVFELSHESIERAKHEILQYQNDINRKTKILVDRLLEIGIRVGRENVGKYGEFITFTKEVTYSNKNGTEELLVMSNTGLVKAEWKVKDGTRSVEINPILMSEFGSGWVADDARGSEFGAGQGTLNTYGHAFNQLGWWWVDLQGVKHHSYGEVPNAPMFKSYYSMANSIMTIAKEVFGND